MPATTLDGKATAAAIRAERTERVAVLLQDVVLPAEQAAASEAQPVAP